MRKRTVGPTQRAGATSGGAAASGSAALQKLFASLTVGQRERLAAVPDAGAAATLAAAATDALKAQTEEAVLAECAAATATASARAAAEAAERAAGAIARRRLTALRQKRLRDQLAAASKKRQRRQRPTVDVRDAEKAVQAALVGLVAGGIAAAEEQARPRPAPRGRQDHVKWEPPDRRGANAQVVRASGGECLEPERAGRRQRRVGWALGLALAAIIVLVLIAALRGLPEGAAARCNELCDAGRGRHGLPAAR